VPQVDRVERAAEQAESHRWQGPSGRVTRSGKTVWTGVQKSGEV
jgi:hypothetical protein